LNKEPRLRFTDEERADPALEKPIRKADKAAAKADKAQAKIPKKKVRQKMVDPETGKVTTKLVLEDKKKPPSKLSHAVRDAPANAALGKLHKEIQEAEQDNVGVESAHKSEEAAETGVRLAREGYRSHKLKPYRKAAQAEQKLEKANVNALYQKSLQENPQLASNPFSRWQQKRTIKKQYAAAKRAGQTAGSATKTAEATGKAAKAAKEKAQQAGAFVMRHKRGFILVGVIFLIVCLLLNTMSSCSMMAQSIGSVVSGTTYPSDDPEMVAVEADYAAKEAALQAEIDGIESSHPGYDEYRYDLDMIGHDPHELAAYLSAVLQGYTQANAQAELDRVFDAQYELTLIEEVETRYRTETRTGTTTSTDPETGEVTTEEYEYEVEVPYDYYILNVKLTSKPISSVASELLTPEQLEMYQVYRSTLGNKPLIFGGGSADTSDSESLTGVQFVNGTRPGNQAVVDIAKSQVGNVGGQPYWSWFGFTSRVEWCACFVSWCYGQMGLSEPRFSACQAQGIPWFQSHGQWGGPDYANIAPGDAIFFDWDLDGRADHVGIVVGTDGSRVYTVEGNSGDACKVRSYSLTYECIKGYGLMNW
jgi:cell wall-associated NlpC family hydrolase